MRSRPPSPLPQKPVRATAPSSARPARAPRRAERGGRGRSLGTNYRAAKLDSGGGLNLSVKLLGLVAIVTMLAVNLVPIGLQWVQQEQEYRAIVAQVEETEAYNDSLRATLRSWDDPDYVASQAKSRLGFVWPGETQYTVKGLPPSQVEDEPVTPKRTAAKPWSALVLESMVDADSVPASEGLSAFTPTEDPTEEAAEAEDEQL